MTSQDVRTPEAAHRPETGARASRTTPVSEVLQQASAALTARARQRNVTLQVVSEAKRRVVSARALRECFLILLADTLETTRHGGVMRVELRDLAGGRVELRIEDTSSAPALPDRAREEADSSGRARTLARAFDRLADEFKARWVSDVDEKARVLLVDVGFPFEE